MFFRQRTPNASFDDRGLQDPRVIRDPSTGVYWLTFSSIGSKFQGTGIATSTDGAHWTKVGRCDADHTKPLHQRMRLKQEPVTTKPTKEEDPVPEHDFAVGVERVFFSPGVLHKIATIYHPNMLKAAFRMEEPIWWKGGSLCELFKGKGCSGGGIQTPREQRDGSALTHLRTVSSCRAQ